ncbi:MAG: FAD-binding oxidoreductase, partial [Methanobacteriota archaeon]
LEEFLLKELNNGSLQFEHHHGGRILFHGHCHQKALVGAEVSRKVLEAAGYEVEVIDSGCCGMAGSFGYEKEHYHYSISMAERKLIPAIWNAAPDTTIVAPGISCRQQILHNTGKDAIHPALALLQALRITQPQEAVVTQNHS